MLAFVAPSSAQVAPSEREVAGSAAEQAGRLREALDDYVTALRTLPEPSFIIGRKKPPGPFDYASRAEAEQRLREGIIRVAVKINPPPAVPEEAQQRLSAGQALAASARTPGDRSAAAAEFRRALLLAPWSASGYFNLGDLQEKLGDYREATRSFELYLLAAPAAQDAVSVRKRIKDLGSHFHVMYNYAHHAVQGTGDFVSGWLTVSNSAVEFHDNAGGKHSVAFPVSDVRSVEMRPGPMGHELLLERRGGKKFLFLGLQDQEAAALEKAIKEMDPQHGIAFK